MDTGHAASAPITDAGKVSVIPASEIAEDSVTTQTSSSDCIPSSLFIESLLENETPEIIVEASPEPLGLSSSPRGLNGVGLQNQPGLILSEEVVSNTTEDLQISAKTSGRDTSELRALSENQGNPIESEEEGKIAEIDGNDRRTIPNSITSGLTEGEAIDGGASPGQWASASPVESEAIECMDQSEVSDRFVHERPRDAECGDKTPTNATDEVSARKENQKQAVPLSQNDLPGSVNVEDDSRRTRQCQPRPNPVAPSLQGSETQNDRPGSSHPNPPNEDRRSSRSSRRPQKYEAPVRTPDALTAPREPRAAPATMRTRALSVLIHAHFGRRNRCQIALLPEREEGLDEIITVKCAGVLEEWSASQDEWYADFIPDDLGHILREGAQWEQVEDPSVRWTLAGRDVYVLAGKPESGIFAFISTTRLLLGEEHIVLCTEEIEETVRRAIVEAGCTDAVMLDGNQGVPNGWLLFKNVRPITALPHNPADGIINILRPVHDIEIELRGGIRIQHLKWLHNHPPQVRLRGQHDNLEVVIDQQVAIQDENRNYTVPGWDAQGVHRAYCGGATASYELIDPPCEWDLFPAFTYKTTAHPLCQTHVCGPLVSTELKNTVLLERNGNTYLLGPVPGQVAFATPAPNLRVPAFIAAADFPIIWAVPSSPLLANKETSTIQLFHHHLPETHKELSKPNGAVRLWAALIMEASYKRLLIEPATDDTKTLWLKYKSIARHIKRGSR